MDDKFIIKVEPKIPAIRDLKQKQIVKTDVYTDDDGLIYAKRKLKGIEIVKNIFKNWKKDLKEEKKLNQEIKTEVKKIRREGRKDRIIAVEKTKQQYMKEDAIDSIDSGGAGSNRFGEMFGKFQDFATDFAKRQDSNNKRRY